MTGRDWLPDLIPSGVLLLDICVFHNEHHVQAWGVHECTWHRSTQGHRLMTDSVVLSSDLWPYVLKTGVKTGDELSVDNHLVMSWIRSEGRMPNRPITWCTQTYSGGGQGAFGWGHCPWDIQIPAQAECLLRLEGGWGDWVKIGCSVLPLLRQLHRAPAIRLLVSCYGGNPWTWWWTPVEREAEKLKKWSYHAWLACRPL